MSERSHDNNGQPPRELTVLPTERREFPHREKEPALQETDDNGDVIFRFKLDRTGQPAVLSLEEFYRQSIRDLLKIVRFYSKGTPVIVDSFAFLNRPHDELRILDDSKPAEP